MSYILNKTDGSKITEIIDGVIDQTTTDLTLIGKNFSSYGEFLNENFIHLLENFSSTAQPNKPITGQLWCMTA
jgi:tRNA A37 methylthiotransferase MiaB